ncbi:MAG: molecular chaperone [Cellvibrionaceae bacterium]|nr:molecular chaperone [Cellvibrionaceae bacterium]
MGLHRYFASIIFFSLLSCLNATTCFSGSLSVWPIDPHLQPPAATAAIWVRNNGDQAVYLQARVFRWRQEFSQEVLEAQDAVVISPPMIEVAPQAQQLFRVVHRGGAPDYPLEQSYRVLLDEIPRARDDNNVPLQFQMRYSLPFFIFPSGHPREKIRENSHLSYRLVMSDKPELQVLNHGPVHVRLSQVHLLAATGRTVLAEGLLGYVLPKSTMSWPLNLDPQQRRDLQTNRELVFTQNRHEYRVIRAD